MDKFLLLVGKSGAGKDSVARKLTALYGLKQLKSFTTRPKRTPDEDCHTFVERLPTGHMVAYTKFNGFEYCATQNQVEENDIYIIDPDGVVDFMRHYRGEKDAFVVYLDVGCITRFVRMLKRGDGVRAALNRIIHDRKKFQALRNIPVVYSVRNKDVTVCAACIAKVLRLEDKNACTLYES